LQKEEIKKRMTELGKPFGHFDPWIWGILGFVSQKSLLIHLSKYTNFHILKKRGKKNHTMLL
jgi:hypothetical protein